MYLGAVDWSARQRFLGPLLESSRATGWAVGEAPLEHLVNYPDLGSSAVRRMAEAEGLTLVPNRSGEHPVSTLTPVVEDQARPGSLSAVVGLGQQPFHTDGAHLRRVPDIVLLWVLQPCETPTLIWQPRLDRSSEGAAGIFLVEPGGEPFLAPAVTGWSSLRFDPVCMKPADASARRVAGLLQSPPESEIESISWDTPGKMLLIRNHRVLHARAAVVEGETERKVFRAALYEGD
jgi:hypothetical protein